MTKRSTLLFLFFVCGRSGSASDSQRRVVRDLRIAAGQKVGYLSDVRKLAVPFVCLLALIIVGAATASGPITITAASVPNRHVSITWVGPPIEFGAVQIATRPETGTDGDFFSENRVEYAILAAGQSAWLSSDPIGPGTYYVRVDGWDNHCTFYDYGYGITGWLGCDVYSNIVQFTVNPICVKKLVRKGYWTKRNGRRIHHKPIYKTVCS